MNMKPKSRLFGFVIRLIAISAVLGAFLFWRADPLNLRAPSDQQLLTIFHEHRATFEQLRQMLVEDLRNAPVDKSGVKQLKAKQSPKYKQLVAEIYPGLETRVDRDESVRFLFEIGMISALGSDWMKGIVYVPGDYHRQGNLLPDLDNARRLPADVYLRQIEPNWFILYQRDE